MESDGILEAPVCGLQQLAGGLISNAGYLPKLRDAILMHSGDIGSHAEHRKNQRT